MKGRMRTWKIVPGPIGSSLVREASRISVCHCGSLAESLTNANTSSTGRLTVTEFSALIMVSSFGSGRRGRGANLLHKPHEVFHPPLLGDLATGDAVEADAGHCDRFAARRHAEEVPFLRA